MTLQRHFVLNTSVNSILIRFLTKVAPESDEQQCGFCWHANWLSHFEDLCSQTQWPVFFGHSLLLTCI